MKERKANMKARVWTFGRCEDHVSHGIVTSYGCKECRCETCLGWKVDPVFAEEISCRCDSGRQQQRQWKTS